MLITRRISWHMAHRILGYRGLCGTIHGHTYSAEISLESSVDVATGMVCDFGDLKTVISEVIDGYFDHSVFLSEADPLVEAIRPHSHRLAVLNGAATAENLGQIIFGLIESRLSMPQFRRSDGTEIKLARIRLWETEKSSVEIARSGYLQSRQAEARGAKLVYLMVDGKETEF